MVNRGGMARLGLLGVLMAFALALGCSGGGGGGGGGPAGKYVLDVARSKARFAEWVKATPKYVTDADREKARQEHAAAVERVFANVGAATITLHADGTYVATEKGMADVSGRWTLNERTGFVAGTPTDRLATPFAARLQGNELVVEVLGTPMEVFTK